MKLISKIAISAGIAGIAALAVVAPANAATSQPIEDTIGTIAPGTSGDIGFYYSNGDATANTGNVTIVLTAPTNATFNQNEVWGMDFPGGESSGSSRPVLTGCTLNGTSTQMTCTGNLTVMAPVGGKQSTLQLTANVAVAADTAAETTFNNGSAVITGGGGITGGTVSLGYKTPAEAETPVIAPVIGAGALAAAGIAGGVALLRRKRA
ncbi:hypothetical protein [Frondihabitans australicus]|uniref:LPXTG-motif cell wall-anchored protein n=1 Tax=Frondihabitans australicus TaxID=386892 RepID=A0A495ID25_9MICO|nr:hypothetical protein [Frondihabitans australicus]RKR73005.1 hypothetical protein C8E83_0087 [Frondihabitans australicus]